MWSAWGRRSGVIDGKKSVPVLRRENAVTSGCAHSTRSARRRQLLDLPMRLPAEGRRWRRGRAHRGSARRKALRHGRRRAEHRGGARREQFERQDPALNAGRWTLDASLPAADPFPDSSVYSLAHRNPHGIAWDRDGRRQATGDRRQNSGRTHGTSSRPSLQVRTTDGPLLRASVQAQPSSIRSMHG